MSKRGLNHANETLKSDRWTNVVVCDLAGVEGVDFDFALFVMAALRWMIPPMVVHPEKIDFRRFV